MKQSIRLTTSLKTDTTLKFEDERNFSTEKSMMLEVTTTMNQQTDYKASKSYSRQVTRESTNYSEESIVERVRKSKRRESNLSNEKERFFFIFCDKSLS